MADNVNIPLTKAQPVGVAPIPERNPSARPFLKIAAAILICLLLLLLSFRVTGFEPPVRHTAAERNKIYNYVGGLWLRGELVTTPVGDWSYTDQYYSIKLQTHTWYGLPHSVTIFCTAYNGHLYLTSQHRAGTQYPEGKQWVKNIARDPRIRLKVGDQLFERTAVYVTDPAERAAVIQARLKKYPNNPVPDSYVFRVTPD